MIFLRVIYSKITIAMLTIGFAICWLIVKGRQESPWTASWTERFKWFCSPWTVVSASRLYIGRRRLGVGRIILRKIIGLNSNVYFFKILNSPWISTVCAPGLRRLRYWIGKNILPLHQKYNCLFCMNCIAILLLMVTVFV